MRRYEIFTKDIQIAVETKVQKKFGDANVVIRDIVKNNSVEMKAISIMKAGENATPTIYLESYYREYEEGKTIDEISNEIIEIYQRGRERINIEIEDFFDFDKIKDRICYRIINYRMNRNLLKDVPHIKYMDLAIVFFVVASRDSEGIATALIHKVHMNTWGVSIDELKKIAEENTIKLFPPEIKRLEDLISDMIISDIRKDSSNTVNEDMIYGDTRINQLEAVVREEVDKLNVMEFEMYVLTNKSRINGATCITYPNVLREFADKLGGDVFIIPSSIHEVLLIPGKDGKQRTIERIIAEVNETELDPVEVLSDHVYYYSREEDTIYM